MGVTAVRNYEVPMWALERERGVVGPYTLRLGRRRVYLDEVAGFQAATHIDRDRHGQFLAFMVFALLAGIYVIGVVEFGWRTRFLLAAVVLFALSAMSFGEVWFQTAKRYTVFNVHLRSGETIVFTTADANDAAALNAVLSRHA